MSIAMNVSTTTRPIRNSTSGLDIRFRSNRTFIAMLVLLIAITPARKIESIRGHPRKDARGHPTKSPMLVSMIASMIAGVFVFLSFENENSRPTKNISITRPTNDSTSIRLISVMRPVYSNPNSSKLILGPMNTPTMM